MNVADKSEDILTKSTTSQSNADNGITTNPITDIIKSILFCTLEGQTFNNDNAKTWTIQIANAINEDIRELRMKRYKHIVQVTIGELKGGGIKSGLRCLWDAETDGYTSEVFTNESIFAVVAVFAVYLY